MPRDVVQLPADGAGKRLDAYSYLSTVTGAPVVYSQTTVPVSSDGAPVFPSSSVALGDGYATPAVSAVAVLPVAFNGATWDRLRTGATLGSLLADVADRAGRALGAVSITGTPTVTVGNPFDGDVIDRAGRLLGHVSVDNFPATQTVAGTVAVSNFPATVDVTDRALRLLGHVSVDNWPASTDVSDRVGRLLGHVSLDGTADVADRAARLLGHVTVDNFPSSQSVAVSNFPATQPVSIAATVTTDVSDRAGRALGAVSLSGTPTVNVGNEFAGDITDRVGRLLGHVTVDNASLTADISDRSARLIGQAGNLVYDGTNWQTQGGIVGDTGQNAGLFAGSRKEVPFSTTTPQAVGATDCSNYRWVSVHITSQGTSSTVNFQVSNDNVNWLATTLVSTGITGGGAGGTATGVANAMMSGPVIGRYFRLNVTGISAGTTSGTMEFFAVPPVPNVVQVGPQPTPGDGAGWSSGGTLVEAFGMVYNGATWDRLRSATGATTGTAAVAEQAATAGGATSFRLLSAATTNLTSLKASAGQIYNITAYNAAATVRYLKVYNKASAPAPATDTPVHTYPLAASGGQLQISFPVGLAFGTGIAFSITGALADADTTAIAANDVILNIDYK